MTTIPDRREDDEPAGITWAVISLMRGIPEDDWTDGTVADLAMRLHRLRVLQGFAHRMGQEIEEHLAASMETDTLDLPTLGHIVRAETTRSAWSSDSAAERLRDDLARAVADDVALDVATGEIDPMKRNVALHALRTAYEAIPSFSSIKQAGARRLNLRISNYRSFATAYAVKIEAIEEQR